MRRRNPRAELVVFVTEHTLPGQKIRPGDAESCRLKSSVKIDHQVVFRGERHNILIPIHHGLVIAIHEVNLDARDTPLFISGKCAVQGAGFLSAIYIA
ncbi:hypothetical protein D1Y84_13610 [Acidipila sp. EB88]|nr:hypothetical protein D1Y84_13610 [Acidipila sp. EB88]